MSLQAERRRGGREGGKERETEMGREMGEREGGREMEVRKIEWREGHEGPLTTRYIPASARACGIDHLGSNINWLYKLVCLFTCRTCGAIFQNCVS